MVVKNNLSFLRAKRDVGASELAQAVGVSRQTIYSIESGSFTPNTAVALRLAQFLNCRVEEIFSLEPEQKPDGESAPAQLIDERKRVYPGQTVQLGRIGSELIAVPGSETAERYPSGVNGIVVQGNRRNASGLTVQILDESLLESSLIVAGCDPAVTLLANPLEKAGVHLAPWLANSSSALALLKENKIHIAGCHMSSAKTGELNLQFIHKITADLELAVISFVLWQEGLLVARGNPKKIQTIGDLARTDVCLVNREQGSGTRCLLDALLAEAAITPRMVCGYNNTMKSHMAVAGEVLSGKADCGLAISSAARLTGLTFIPLTTERYDFVVRKEWLGEKPIQRFFEELSRSAIQHRLEAVCGYDATHCGETAV